MVAVTTTSASLAMGILAATLGFGCASRAVARALTPATEGLAAPELTRVAIELAGEEEWRMFAHGAGRHGQSIVKTRTPFEGPVYDTARDRFVLPGFWAIDRAGAITFDADPLRAPAGAHVRSAAELHEMFDLDPAVEVVVAVHEDERTLSVLTTVPLPSKVNAHARRTSDVIVVRRLDIASRRVLDAVELPVASRGSRWGSGWDPDSTLARFLRDGTVVAALDLSRRNRKGGYRPAQPARLPRTRGARAATVRLAPDGEVTVVTRRAWYDAALSAGDEVVGIRERSRAFLAFDLDGTRTFRSPVALRFDDAAAHAHGFCALAPTQEPTPRRMIICFDRGGVETWRRSAPSGVYGWLVDDGGWVYLSVVGSASDWKLIAIDPKGSTAWEIQVPGVAGKLMAVGQHELCFLTGPVQWTPAAAPELVCVRRRHGERRNR